MAPPPVEVALQQGIYLLRPDDGSWELLSESAAYNIAWTPDGEAIWYATTFYPATVGTVPDSPMQVRAISAADGSDALIYDLNGGGLTELSPAKERVVFVRHLGHVEDPSRLQGGRIEYSAHVIDRQGERDLGSAIMKDMDPSGRWLLMESPACTDDTLQLIDLDTGARSEPFPQFHVYDFEWRADGLIRLNYREGDEPGNGLYDLDRHTFIDPVDAIGFGVYGLLSPDGAYHVYSAYGRTFVRDIASRAQIDLGPGHIREVLWNPDSKSFAYIEGAEIIVRDPQADVLRTFSFSVVEDARNAGLYQIRWSPDGSTLALASSNYGGRGVCD